MPQLTTFNQAIQNTLGTKRNLLVGNGFSIAATPAFCYQSLYMLTDFNGIESAKLLFTHFNTVDFEQIIRYLDITSKVSLSLKNKDFSDYLEKVKIILIDRFVHSLVDIHPTNLYPEGSKACISPRNMVNNNNFLSYFTSSGRIFTLNYDLLLYWSLLDGFTNKRLDFRDGFTNGSHWDTYYSTTLFFLHGAFHLRTDPYGSTYKLNYISNNSLLSQTISDLQNSLYPLIVFEGTSDNKLKKIKNNRYLSMCYDSLTKSEDNLFTYGVALSDNDWHIVDAITNSQLSSIYIGMYFDPNFGGPNYDKNTLKAISWFELSGKKVFIYPTKVFSIW